MKTQVELLPPPENINYQIMPCLQAFHELSPAIQLDIARDGLRIMVGRRQIQAQLSSEQRVESEQERPEQR